MGRLRLTQQTIVFGIFAVMFAAFALFLPGFATTQNIFTLLQNVAVLGILGLAMALVVTIGVVGFVLDRLMSLVEKRFKTA